MAQLSLIQRYGAAYDNRISKPNRKLLRAGESDSGAGLTGKGSAIP
jgi:hypothetical protein